MCDIKIYELISLLRFDYSITIQLVHCNLTHPLQFESSATIWLVRCDSTIFCDSAYLSRFDSSIAIQLTRHNLTRCVAIQLICHDSTHSYRLESFYRNSSHPSQFDSFVTIRLNRRSSSHLSWVDSAVTIWFIRCDYRKTWFRSSDLIDCKKRGILFAAPQMMDRKRPVNVVTEVLLCV